MGNSNPASLKKEKAMHITGYTIGLNDIHIYAFHGVMLQEREIGGWFTINLELTIDEHINFSCDDIEKTVSYADVYEVICYEMKIPSDLLEHVCTRISESLYNRFPLLKEIDITLQKDTPPMGGDGMKARVTLKSRR